MKCQHAMLLVALCAVISACDAPDTTMQNGAVTLKDNVVTLHVSGAPDALIDSSGSLHIDDKTVSTTAPQRGLLMLYYQSVTDVRQTGIEMGKVGAGMGMKALKNAMDDKSKSQQDQDADAGAGRIKTLSQKICSDQANMKNVQDQLAAQLSAFKPYGNIFSSHDIDDCMKDD